VTDYGHPLWFGVLLEPPVDQPLAVVELAEVSEDAGLDLVSLSDHPYWPQRLDTLTLLAAIAERTSRIRLMSNLANLPLRPPAMLARVATTLDLLSGGRFDLGIATGAQQLWDGVIADGGPPRDAGESIEALQEAVQIIRALWAPDGPPVRFEGRHYRLGGAAPGPAALHDIELWFGAYQPRLLKLTGAMADGWLPSSPFFAPHEFSAANRLIDEAATAADRAPAAVRRGYNIDGDFAGAGPGFLQGPPAVWAEQLTELVLSEGVSTLVLYRACDATTIERFGHEVAPAVRELVDAERARQLVG
jgi:alkanesulfonate monooxygenase SsuD/methylene tetrahydromethanopterin reductase-like flavin-dependent oxidoreductase (luciferase family)